MSDIDKKAALICGHLAVDHRGGCCVPFRINDSCGGIYLDYTHYTYDVFNITYRIFSLDNRHDLVDTVISLGVNHQTDIIGSSDCESKHTGWHN